MEPEREEFSPKILIPTLLVSLVLFAGMYIAYRTARSRPSTIVLPGGSTYLGPIPTPMTPQRSWKTYKGKFFPYSFRYPSSFSLGWFTNDPYDAVTAFIPNTDANANIFFRVYDLTKLKKTAYIGKPMDYAQNWWKDYTWKGVSSVTMFTNAAGLTGYRARYIDTSGNTPYDHVFFEVPGRTDLIVWMSGKLFTQDVFEKVVDSVEWK